MIPEDIIVEIRNVDLERVGQIATKYLSDPKWIKNFCNVGSWSMTLPTDLWEASLLAEEGAGIIVTGLDNKVIISGNMLTVENQKTSDDPRGVWVFNGIDDNVHLGDALAWPDPTNPVLPGSQSNDIRAGVAETVIRGYVSDNIGPTADPDRQITGLALQPDLGRGAAVIGNARFDKLGQLIGDLASSGGVGFDVIQNGDQKEFTIYAPADKSLEIRMDIDNDQLSSAKYGFGAPSGTRALVAGQGEGTARQILKITSPDSAGSEAAWGRKIESFIDRRDTDDPAELTQSGLDVVTTGALPSKTLSVTPSDDLSMVFLKDWFLGDVVGVVVDDQDISAVVTQAAISIDSTGVHTAAIIGDPTGFDYESKIAASVADNAKRIGALETRQGVADIGLLALLVSPGDLKPIAYTPSGAIDGWLYCDGSAVSRTSYAALFSAIGSDFGPGDGVSTFNVPDYRGVTLFGATGSAPFDGPGTTGGSLDHSHDLSDAGQAQVRIGAPAGVAGVHIRQVATPTFNPTDRVASATSTGSGNSAFGAALTGATDDASSLPPFGVANWLIKT